MTTLKDIAEEAGVSVMTVSRILNGENKETWPSTIRRAKEIRAIAQRLNFRPNATARTMRTNKTKLIGVLIRNTQDLPFASPANYEAILGIYHELEHAGYEMCLVHQSGLNQRSRIFREHMLDGLIALGHMESDWISEIGKLFEHCVWTDTNVNEPTMCVRRDEHDAGCMVGRTIVQYGYRKVIWLGHSEDERVPHYSRVERLEGLKQGLGKKLASSLEYVTSDPQSDAPIRDLMDQVDATTAIVPYDLKHAQLVLTELYRRRLWAGQAAGLACADDSYHMREAGTDLCRVMFDRRQMGKDASRMLLEHLAGKKSKSITLKSQWIDGSTLVKH